MDKDFLVAAGSHYIRDTTGLAVRRIQSQIQESCIPGTNSVRQIDDYYQQFQRQRQIKQIQSVQDSTDTLKSLRQRLQLFKRTHSDTVNKLNDTKYQLDQVKNENKQLHEIKKKYDFAQINRVRMENELNKFTKQNTKLQDELNLYLQKGLQEQLLEHKQKLVRMQNEIDILKIDNKKLQQCNSLQRIQLNQQIQLSDHQKTTLNFKIKSLTSQKNKLLKQNSFLNDKIIYIENANGIDATQRQQKIKALSLLKQQYQNIKNQLSDKQDQCLALLTDMDRQKINFHQLQSNLTANVQRYAIQNKKIRRQAQQLKINIAQQQAKLDQFKQDNQNLRKQNQNLQKQIRKLSIDLQQASQNSSKGDNWAKKLQIQNQALKLKLRKVHDFRLRDRHVAYQLQTLRYDTITQKDKQIRKIQQLVSEITNQSYFMK